MTTHDDRVLKGEGRPAAPLSRAHAAAVLRLGVSVEQDGASGARAAGLEDREGGSIAPNAPFAGDTRRAAAAGGITVAMLVAAGIGIPDSGQIAPIGGATGGSVEGRPGSTAVRSAIAAGDDRRQEQDPMKSPGVRAAVMAGVVMVASSAGAQQMPAVQWRVEDGGNGHWYQRTELMPDWDTARLYAGARGGHLATISSLSENEFAAALNGSSACFLGGFQSSSACEPGCEWSWITGEPWSFVNWDAGQPDNYTGGGGGNENYLSYFYGPKWNDGNGLGPSDAIIEYSADCNADGIVDYGQILAGDLSDADSNGIPDVCEVPSCIDADLNPNGIVDGADLGAMLAFWGPVSPAFPRADINGDGTVNGADLGILLSLWGPCGG
jgi:hypothetical protein